MIIKTMASPDPGGKAVTPEATAAEQPRAGQGGGAGAARLEPHPLSMIFPELEAEAYAELVEDIRRHGVREPITLFVGKILDGRNRYRAAIDAGVECQTTEYVGDDPLGFVISLNLNRRHLKESQRTMVALEIATMRQGARTDLAPSANLPEVSQADAAKRLNVSERSVRSAKTVSEKGVPALVAAVKAGRVSVAAAAAAAQLPESEQREAVAEGKEGVRAAAKKARSGKPARRQPKRTDLMLTELHHLAGYCQDIAPDKFLPALASETRRQEALGSMRIVSDWMEAASTAERGPQLKESNS